MNLSSCFLFLLLPLQSVISFKFVCYISIDHHPFTDDSFTVSTFFENFDVNICTHINILPSILTNDYDLALSQENHKSVIQELVWLKKLNPKLKLLTTLIPDPYLMSDALSSTQTRERLVKNIINFIELFNLDGIDLDWEFPVYTTRRLRDRRNFVAFLQSLRSQINLSEKNLLMTAAVAADPTIIAPAYDIPKLNELLDFVNLMTYDFTDWHPHYPFLGLNAPLFPFSSLPYFSKLNVASAINHWINGGLHPSKLIVGIPTYAHTFQLLLPQLNQVSSPAKGPGPNMNFGQVCSFLRQTNAKSEFHQRARVPFAYNSSIWVSYESKDSALEKARWIKYRSLGGVMTFNLNNDDYLGNCAGNGSFNPIESFPLHNIISNVFKE